MSHQFYVYALLRPDKCDPFGSELDQPFYVGKGKNNRIFKHRKVAKFLLKNPQAKNINPIKNNIIHKLWRNSLDFVEEIFYSNLSEPEAFKIEKELISKYGRIDLGTGCLSNMTDGGDGVNGFVPSEKTRELWRQQNAGEGNPFFGHTHNSYTRLIIGSYHKDKIMSLETRVSIGNTLRGRKRSKEDIDKMKENSGRKIPVEIDGFQYESFTEAYTALNISRSNFRKNLYVEKLPNYILLVKCKNCGTKTKSGEKYCSGCGTCIVKLD